MGAWFLSSTYSLGPCSQFAGFGAACARAAARSRGHALICPCCTASCWCQQWQSTAVMQSTMHPGSHEVWNGPTSVVAARTSGRAPQPTLQRRVGRLHTSHSNERVTSTDALRPAFRTVRGDVHLPPRRVTRRPARRTRKRANATDNSGRPEYVQSLAQPDLIYKSFTVRPAARTKTSTDTRGG